MLDTVRQVIKVKMRADEEGKTIFDDTKDDNIRMTVEIDVEVVALYRLNQTVYEDGVLRLPEPRILSGYAKPEGERGTAIYNPGGFIRLGGWSEDKKKVIQDSLAYAALNAGKKQFQDKEEYKQLEELFAKEFAQEVARLHKQNTAMDKYEERLKQAEQKRPRK